MGKEACIYITICSHIIKQIKPKNCFKHAECPLGLPLDLDLQINFGCMRAETSLTNKEKAFLNQTRCDANTLNYFFFFK